MTEHSRRPSVREKLAARFRLARAKTSQQPLRVVMQFDHRGEVVRGLAVPVNDEEFRRSPSEPSDG